MKLVKKILCLMVIIISSMTVSTYAAAESEDGGGAGVGLPAESHWIDTDEYNPTTHEYSVELMLLSRRIMGYITTIGAIVSVVVLTILGLKYMTGSVEEKAEFKKDMFPYIVGAILTFGVSGIMQVVLELTNQVFE